MSLHSLALKYKKPFWELFLSDFFYVVTNAVKKKGGTFKKDHTFFPLSLACGVEGCDSLDLSSATFKC